MKLDKTLLSTLHLNENWRTVLVELPNQPWFSRVPVVLTTLMILLLSSSLAKFTWLVLEPAETHRQVSQTIRSVQAPKAQASFKEVANLHLFGEADVKLVPSARALINAPNTRLRLTLRGVLAIDDPTLAIAIIADDKGKEKYYKTGAALPGNATLHTIYADRVILSRAKGLETLPLPTKKLPNNAIVRNQSMSRSVKAPSGLSTLRTNLIKNPQQIWKNVRLEPRIQKNGSIQGYTLSHKDKRLMRGLGIRKTDVITAVNGLPLNDPTSLYQVLEVLKTSNQINLSIIRNGREETLDITM